MSVIKITSINRHRLSVDGKGVTTLVGNSYCNLYCKYCLNKIHQKRNVKLYSPKELLEELKIDDLYFMTTGGGITFGGGEPLLDIDFLEEFKYLKESSGYKWTLTVESALNVPLTVLKRALKVFDCFIIDIKSIDDEIYKSYTGVSNKNLIENLCYISSLICSDKLDSSRFLLRIPIIEGYSSDYSVHMSRAYLTHLGFDKFDMFKYIIK